MEKHLLVTVGDDLNSLYGVRFISSFFRNKEGLRVSLLYIVPTFDSMETKEYTRLHDIDLKLFEIYREKGQKALDESQKILTLSGFSKSQTATRLIHKHYGTVTDLIQEMSTAQYQALVLGRRGYSILEKAFSKSLSEEILEYEVNFPVWICRHPERGRKNLLLCVDGSEPSRRVTEHAGIFMEKEDEQTITLFHVADTEGSAGEIVLAEAREILLGQKLSAERIRSALVSAPDVAEAIFREAESGAFAAVAIGHRGLTASGALHEASLGSTAFKLLQTLDDAALWIST